MIYDFIIVGSGISGALAAKFLKEKKYKILVLESEEQIGGRFSTIEIDNKSYNNGNIFIRDSHEALVSLLNNFLTKPLEKIRLDYVNLIDKQYHIDSRYVYLPESGRMDDICNDLLTDVEIFVKSEVQSVKKVEENIEVACLEKKYLCKNLILTVPTFIAQKLLNDLELEIEVPNFNTIFTLLGEYDPSIKDFDFPYYKFINHPVLKEIFINKNDNTVVIHANDYMREPLKSMDMNLVRSTIFKNYKNYFDIEVIVKKFHIWKFAKNLERKKFQNEYQLDNNKVFLISDWVSKSPNINGVAQSFIRFVKHLEQGD